MNDRLNRIVLIHGGSHGAWCWEMVVPLLKARGFKIMAPDLPGSGEDTTRLQDITFAAYTACVVANLTAHDGPALLVGHSMGGGPISQAAEQAPNRVGKLVYLSALLPKDGETAMDGMEALKMGESAARGTTWCPSGDAVETDRSLAPEIFYNKCAPEVAHAASLRLRPQATKPLASACRLSDARWGAIPKTYVVCTADRAMPPMAQHWYCGRRADVKMVEREWDHSPFYSDPRGLADLLEEEALND